MIKITLLESGKENSQVGQFWEDLQSRLDQNNFDRYRVSFDIVKCQILSMFVF